MEHSWGGPGRWRAGLVLVLAVGLGRVAPPAARAAEVDVRRDAAVEAVARVMPAVVNISTETIVAVRDPYEEMLQEFWGPYHRRRPSTTKQYSLGSGVIIDEEGYVLTNDHVVRRASHIGVRMADEAGGKEYEARLVGGTGKSDLALLRILAKPGEKFRAVRFAADDDLLLGETVLALGNPFGLGGSVTRGILSSRSRRPAVENTPLGLPDWLQTDAAINPGNSGGPLINLRGDLLGISVAVYREGQGIGFAIPIKRVTEALLEISSPQMRELWFGARVRPGGATLVVSSLERGSPAERAGLRSGDVIVAVNGRAPRGFIDFISEVSRAGDQRPVELSVQRGGGRQEVSVRLVREAAVFNAALINQRLGLSVQAVTPELAERLGLDTEGGLLVVAVERDGPAAAARLPRGVVVLTIDGQTPDDVVEAAKMLHAKRRGDRVVLETAAQVRNGPFLMWERNSYDVPVR